MFFLAFLTFIIITFTGTASFTRHSNSWSKSSESQVSAFKQLADHYTYVHVLKDGIWWIQVYNDQGILIDEYPED